MTRKVKLGVNIDHVATLRNARGEHYPSVLRAAQLVQECGGDGITVHLREDRRHIRDKDVYDIKEHIKLPLNFECAATDVMLEIALKVIPNSCCLVPEKREELTTEGGLDVIKNFEVLKNFSREIKAKNIKPSFFIDADIEQLKASKEAGAEIVEFHTGSYCSAFYSDVSSRASEGSVAIQKTGLLRSQTTARNDVIGVELEKIRKASAEADKLGIICHAGHGLNYDTIPDIVKIPQIMELNIGHFIIGEAVFVGLAEVMRKMKNTINSNR